MEPITTIPTDRYIFCRLASSGKLVIAKYSSKHCLFEVVRDEIYYYMPDDFTEWFDLLNKEK
jgi:hypothetical protein